MKTAFNIPVFYYTPVVLCHSTTYLCLYEVTILIVVTTMETTADRIICNQRQIHN